MSILVIAPHPDDEAIGCGGTILLRVARGERVTAAFLTSGELGLEHLPRQEAWRIREGEARAAAMRLGLSGVTFLRRHDWLVEDEVEEAAAELRPIIERENPHTIFLPHPGEWHPDHRSALPVLRAALRGMKVNDCPCCWAYEVWTPLPEYDHVEDITPVMPGKLRAIRCYRSQLPGFRYDRAARGLAMYRGAMAAHSRYAEVFASLPLSVVSCQLPGTVDERSELLTTDN